MSASASVDVSTASVHSLWTTAAPVVDKIPTPHIEYAQLSPVLIVFGAAMLGILFEAFLPRRSRYTAQVTLSVIGLAAAFAAVVALAEKGYGTTKAHIAAMGAVAVDGPALFLQGTILLVSIVAVFTFAERRLDPKAHGRRRRLLRRAGLGRPRRRPGEGRGQGRVHLHRGLPAAALRGRRHAGLPGRERPADALRRP